MITPDDFDTLVQDTLRAVDAGTRPDPSAAGRLIANAREGETKVVPLRPRRSAWLAPLIAAAAVIAVALSIVLIADRGGDKPVPPATGGPTASVTSDPIASYSPTSVPSTTKVPQRTHSTTPPIPGAPKVAGFSVTSLQYISQSVGWALGDGKCATGTKTNCATLLHTTDDGNHWTKVSVPAGVVSTKDPASCGDNGGIAGPCIDTINFANDTVGYTWGYHDLYVTTDAGKHWTDVHADLTYDVQFVGSQAVRLSGHHACSSGCEYGAFAAPLGSTHFTQVVPWSTQPGGEWRLVAGGGVGYLLEVLFNSSGSSSINTLYHSSDGTHWARKSEVCKGRSVKSLAVNFQGKATTTCE